MASSRIQRLLHDEAAPGIVLIAVAALAIALANSPLRGAIEQLFDTRSPSATARWGSASRCCCGSTTG